jgi:hypothetical protein
VTERRRTPAEKRSLEDRLAEMENWRELWVDPKLQYHGDMISKLKDFQRLVISSGLAVGALVGFFANEIKRRLGLGA